MKSGISISTISFPPYYSFIQLADVSPPYLDPSVGLEPSSTRSMNPNSVLEKEMSLENLTIIIILHRRRNQNQHA